MHNYPTQEDAKVKNTVDNIEAVVAATKKLKSTYSKYKTQVKAESTNRVDSQELAQQAHQVLEQILNYTGSDNSLDKEAQDRYQYLQEENKRIQKELVKTNNKVDKAIDKARDMWESVVRAHRELADLLNTPCHLTEHEAKPYNGEAPQSSAETVEDEPVEDEPEESDNYYT